MNQLALITEVPEPRRVTHDCGAPAVEQFFFSPRVQGITSVVVCSKCTPTFYPGALRQLPVAAKPVRSIAAASQEKRTA